MNKKLTQLIPFGNRRRHWYEKSFNGSNITWMCSVLGGLGLGAGLMYIFDPDRGKYRRDVARDKVTSTVNRTGQAISDTSRDLQNRARGVIAETSSLFHKDKAVSEPELRRAQVLKGAE